MICFAKLVSGELVVGTIANNQIKDVIKVDFFLDPQGKTNINVSPYLPSKILPTLPTERVMCSTPLDIEQYPELLEIYTSILNGQYQNMPTYKH
jgi:hypothetical protein